MRLADISQSLKRTMRREDIRAAAFIPLVIEGNLIGKFHDLLSRAACVHPFRA